jgi:hypothetical protein
LEEKIGRAGVVTDDEDDVAGCRPGHQLREVDSDTAVFGTAQDAVCALLPQSISPVLVCSWQVGCVGEAVGLTVATFREPAPL